MPIPVLFLPLLMKSSNLGKKQSLHVLKVQIRQKESEFAKERAILQQKVQLLELQLKDSIDREESQKKMHETMINCLNKDDSSSKKSISPTEKAAQQEVKELQESKKRLQEEFENRNTQMKDKLDEKDRKIKELEERVERLINEKFQIQYSSDNEKKELQTKIHFLQNERDQAFDKAEFKSQSLVGQLQMENERLRLEQQREIEKIKSECEASLKEIKYFHEQEKHSLEYKLEKSSHELLTLKSFLKSREDFNEDVRESQQTMRLRRENLEKEVEFLQNEIESMRVQWTDQMKKLEKEKKDAESNTLKVQKQLDKLKNAPKPVKIDLKPTDQDTLQAKQIKNLREEVQALTEQNDKLIEQIKKQRKEIIESQEYMEKVEQSEKKMRQQLQEKQREWEGERIEMRKQINNEKKRNLDVQENNQKIRDSYEFNKNKHLQDLLDKDEKIIKLTRELRDVERKLADNKSQTRNASPFLIDQSQINPKNVYYSPIGYPQPSNLGFQINQSVSNLHQGSPSHKTFEGMKQISQIDHTFLKTCQRMAENASKMECCHCFLLFETSDFYDHLLNDHPQQKLNQSLGGIHQSHGSVTTNSAFQSKPQCFSRRNFQEDIVYTNGSHQSPSPIGQNLALPCANSKKQLQKLGHNSRSFTCLLNEIEEEEKQMSTDPSRLTTHENLEEQQKQSPQLKIVQRKTSNEFKRSRNANNSTVLMGNTTQSMGYGNTIQSVQRTQREQYLKKKQGNQTARTNVSPMMACRTEIQNLKRENKKLTTQLSTHDSKLQDVVKDQQKIKKKLTQEQKIDKEKEQKLTHEIKDLLHKLVSYQGKSTTKNNQICHTQRVITRKKDQENDMKNSASLSSNQVHKVFNKQNHKSPIVPSFKNHNSNKENQNFLLVPKNRESFHFQSSDMESCYLITQKSDNGSVLLTMGEPERKKDIAESNCKVSPNRFHNYFEVLRDMPSMIVDNPKSNKPRYSPTKESMSNYEFQKVIPLMHNKSKTNFIGKQPSRDDSSPCHAFNSKHTNNSSQHHLVLYDSSNTDMFKSKINKMSSCNLNQPNAFNYECESTKKLDFDENQYMHQDINHQCLNMQTSSSCPSMEFVANHEHEVDSDPFVTGRFCQNSMEGTQKQFLFMQPSIKSSNHKKFQ